MLNLELDKLALVANVRRACLAGNGRELRRAAGVSVGEAAAALGVDTATLSRWERGRQMPRAQRALDYANLIVSWLEDSQ